MPELPEVERARRLIHGVSVGRTIAKVTSSDDSIVFTGGISHSQFAETLTGRTVLDSDRRGKIFFLRLDTPPYPVFHFGMTGSVCVKGQAGLKYVDFDTSDCETQWPPRFYKFIIHLNDGTEWAFTDPRRLARIRLVHDPLSMPPISDLGCDPILNMMSLAEFMTGVRTRRMAVKALLLDQSFLAGVGNWVADEVLYAAKIHPAMSTQVLTDDELSGLYRAVVDILTFAVKVNADDTQFPASWLFHYRWFKGKRSGSKEPPTMPNGDRIAFETIGGRTSAIIPKVQKLRKTNKAMDVSKDQKSDHEDTKSKKVKSSVKIEDDDKEHVVADAHVDEVVQDDNPDTKKRKRGRPAKVVQNEDAKPVTRSSSRKRKQTT